MLNAWKLTRSVAFDVYISHFFAHIAHIHDGSAFCNIWKINILSV